MKTNDNRESPVNLKQAILNVKSIRFTDLQRFTEAYRKTVRLTQAQVYRFTPPFKGVNRKAWVSWMDETKKNQNDKRTPSPYRTCGTCQTVDITDICKASVGDSAGQLDQKKLLRRFTAGDTKCCPGQQGCSFCNLFRGFLPLLQAMICLQNALERVLGGRATVAIIKS